jgi:Ser/Thr protein kinase RdoA (MazF antagonist)
LLELIRERVLPRFPIGPRATITPLSGGLINQTFLVTGDDRRLILQRVNPLFPSSIHDNIQAVTTALVRRGLITPLLVPTLDGQRFLELFGTEGGDGGHAVWRVMTHVEGASFDVVTGPAQARAAGALVARFHTALTELSHVFVGLRASVHDTAGHLDHLRRAVGAHRDHRLFAAVSSLAQEILRRAAELPTLPALPPRVCHGDLKFNNLLFAGQSAPLRDTALCLIDLDTVGPMPLAFEMGDAWRSWCNRNGEDNEVAELDLQVFAASLDGYRDGLARSLTPDEQRALLLGPEWISLELSARFAADALAETYFGWDSLRFAGRGEHNLVRARGQFSLFAALADSRPGRARLMTGGA